MVSASSAISISALTVCSGTGFDEEAVKRDLDIMTVVDKDDSDAGAAPVQCCTGYISVSAAKKRALINTGTLQCWGIRSTDQH